jgi:DNA invertase Pin-like site-specific DNA recombinase
MTQQPGNGNGFNSGFNGGFNGGYQMGYNPYMPYPPPGMVYPPMGFMGPIGYPHHTIIENPQINYWHNNLYANHYNPYLYLQYPPIPIDPTNYTNSNSNKPNKDVKKDIIEDAEIVELVEEVVNVNNEPIIKKLDKKMDIIIDENPPELEPLNPLGEYIPDEPVVIPQEKSKKKSATKQVNIDKFIDKFDNVLDGNIQCNPEESVKPTKPMKLIYTNSKKKSTIISQLTPVEKIAHWNNITHPNEQYNAVLMNGNNTIYTATELSNYTLETHQYINKYNSSLINKKQKNSSKHKQNPIMGFIYARCSAENDTSIETQITACMEYARNKSIKLLPFGCQYDNGISARNMNNMDYELGVWSDYLEDGTHLIIYSVDRLSRHLLKGLQYLEKMVARGVSVHFVMSEIIYDANISAAAKSMVQMELQASEKVSNQTSEKVRATIKRKRSEGNVFGKAKFGYKHIKINGIIRRVINLTEMIVIEHIKNLFAKMVSNPRKYSELSKYNGYSHHHITEIDIIKAVIRDCNRKGMRYRNGKPLTPTHIRRILDHNYLDVDADDEEDVAKEDVAEEDIAEEDIAEEDIAEEDIAEEDV